MGLNKRREYNETRVKIDRYLQKLEDPHCREENLIVDSCREYGLDYCPKICSFARDKFSRGEII